MAEVLDGQEGFFDFGWCREGWRDEEDGDGGGNGGGYFGRVDIQGQGCGNDVIGGGVEVINWWLLVQDCECYVWEFGVRFLSGGQCVLEVVYIFS